MEACARWEIDVAEGWLQDGVENQAKWQSKEGRWLLPWERRIATVGGEGVVVQSRGGK